MPEKMTEQDRKQEIAKLNRRELVSTWAAIEGLAVYAVGSHVQNMPLGAKYGFSALGALAAGVALTVAADSWLQARELKQEQQLDIAGE